jgi:voltage-gated potassium channel Kch
VVLTLGRRNDTPAPSQTACALPDYMRQILAKCNFKGHFLYYGLGKAQRKNLTSKDLTMSQKSSHSDQASASTTSKVSQLRYRFDLALSRGTSVVIAWLAVLTLIIILLAALVLTIFRLKGINGEANHAGLIENYWLSMTRVLDAGTFTGDKSWPTRATTLLVTLSGIFIAGSLIGLIANSVDQKVNELQRGRSPVQENDHTIILGWSPRVPSIVSELILANESRKKAAVVILADVDKTEIEEKLRESIDDFKTTRLVARRGEPWVASDLTMVNISKARSVIVVSDGTDTNSIKTLLAIRSLQNSLSNKLPVIAEISDRAIAASLKNLLGDNVVTVSSDETVAELTAQACRQRGLSAVFRELLDFDGDELYFAPFQQFVGQTYQSVLMSFEKCTVFGVMHQGSHVELNPSSDYVIVDGDEILALVEDDSLFIPASSPITGNILVGTPTAKNNQPRRIVIAGWSDLGPRVLAELDEFLDSRTTIELLIDPTLVNVAELRNQLSTSNVTLEVSELSGGPEIVAARAAEKSFHEVIVLGYRNAMSETDADARTLLTLIAFNQVRQGDDVGPVRIVAELLDQRNTSLADSTGVDDFVVSDELTSLMLAQLSERAELSLVFDDLFDHSRCSIELQSVSIFGAENAQTFADVVMSASAVGKTAIGYRVTSTGQVVTNPAKSAQLSLKASDEIIVIADGVTLA